MKIFLLGIQKYDNSDLKCVSATLSGIEKCLIEQGIPKESIIKNDNIVEFKDIYNILKVNSTETSKADPAPWRIIENVDRVFTFFCGKISLTGSNQICVKDRQNLKSFSLNSWISDRISDAHYYLYIKSFGRIGDHEWSGPGCTQNTWVAIDQDESDSMNSCEKFIKVVKNSFHDINQFAEELDLKTIPSHPKRGSEFDLKFTEMFKRK